MENAFTLAEMANTADYAAMNYGELLKTKLAFTGAVGLQINPLLEEKRLDEMAKITHIYMTAMNGYDATKSEILTLLEAEGMKETRLFTHTQDVDDQTQDAVTSVESRSDQEQSQPILLLPEHLEVVDERVNHRVDDDPADNNGGEQESASSEDVISTDIIEKAIEMAKNHPLPDSVNEDASYYVENGYSLDENGNLRQGHTTGRNLSSKDLNAFRSAAEKYVKLFLEEDILTATDNCLVSTRGKKTIYVTLYHYSENDNLGADAEVNEKNLSYDEKTRRRNGRRQLRQAINDAKDLSFSDGTSPDMPFYDRYTFHRELIFPPKLESGRQRFNKDAAELSEIIPAIETYANFYGQDSLVLSKDNCVAAMYGKTIFVVLFNIPAQQKKVVEHVVKRRGRPKKSVPAAQEPPVSEEPKAVSNSTTQTVDDLIQKAVDLTRDLPLTNGTDVNSAYYLQSSFSVTNEGALIYNGKPFSSNVSLDNLDRCRRKHEKYARTMKASKIVAANGYTAFVNNDGKTITVYYYSTKAANACSC